MSECSVGTFLELLKEIWERFSVGIENDFVPIVFCCALWLWCDVLSWENFEYVFKRCFFARFVVFKRLYSSFLRTWMKHFLHRFCHFWMHFRHSLKNVFKEFNFCFSRRRLMCSLLLAWITPTIFGVVVEKQDLFLFSNYADGIAWKRVLSLCSLFNYLQCLVKWIMCCSVLWFRICCGNGLFYIRVHSARNWGILFSGA